MPRFSSFSPLFVTAALAAGFLFGSRVTRGAPLADGHAKFLGSCYSTPQTTGFETYFNQVVPENAGKWGSIEGTRNVMNWAELDRTYALAKSNGLPFRFHVLVWGSQQPSWINSLSAADQLTEITEWFDAVAARYPAIDYLEVVNEATRQPPDGSGTNTANYIAALGGKGATGWDWVLTAFRMARARFPKTTKLVLNDYGLTNDDANAVKYVGIVNLLKAENLIDVVAVQAHYFSTRSYSGNLAATSAQTKANLDRLAATGLPIMVTEMDIDGVTPNTTVQDDALQLSEYQRIFPIFWEHPSVLGITLWGFRPGLWRDAQKAYLVLNDGTERPAMQWLRTYLTAVKPAFTSQPQGGEIEDGGNLALAAAASSTPAPTLQWKRNGVAIAGATTGSLSLANIHVADTGLYTLAATGVSATVSSAPAVVGLKSGVKVLGEGKVVGEGIVHPNGNVFDQVLVTGAAEAITASYSEDPAKTKITRTSFVDLDDDIVQVELSGPGTLSLVLDGATSPAPAVNYNQPDVSYVKGHAGIVITGATEQTNVSVFTVGRKTAVNPALFKDGVNYDGIADIAFIAIASSNGKFGGVRTANANYFASKGLTGLYAPGVQFLGPVYIGNITAFESATPVIQIGSAVETMINGGDLEQANGAAVQVSGLTKLQFVPGSDSHGNPVAAKANKAVLKQDGQDVTGQIVVNP